MGNLTLGSFDFRGQLKQLLHDLEKLESRSRVMIEQAETSKPLGIIISQL